MTLPFASGKWYSREMERVLTPLDALLKKVEECSVAEMIALPQQQRERMRRANLHIVDSPRAEKEDEPKG